MERIFTAINEGWEKQGRQEHGWFGHGTSAQSPETIQGGRDDEKAMAVTTRSIAYGVVGHLPAARRKIYETWLAHGGLTALTESLTAWTKSATSGRDGFRDRFLPSTASDELTDHLLKATKAAAGAGTQSEQRAAILHLSAAVDIVGIDRLPRFFAGIHQQIAALTNTTDHGMIAPIQPAQAPALLTPRPPFLFAEPPKGIIPRFMERIPRQSGKEAADDLPSWARGARRMVGETPRDYARRLMDEHHGPGNWQPTYREFNQLKKHGERAFRDPKESPPMQDTDQPEA